MCQEELTADEQDFVKLNANEIRQFANEQFAGSIDMDKREVYQALFLKAGGRQNICFTCGRSLKQLAKRLEQWL